MTPFRPIADATAFRRCVVLGETHESRSLEFKGEYRWQKAKHRPEDMANQAEELCRDIAQFANSDGGVLLIGVTERATDDGRRVADAIQTVENIDAFKQWAEQAIRNHLTPATFSRALDTIVLPEGNVLAVNIPPALHLVALWHPDRKNGIEYLYRTDHGKQWMNPDEVERHLMNGSRAMQIQLDRVRNEARSAGGNIQVELTPPLMEWMQVATPQGELVPSTRSVVMNHALRSEHEVELRVGTPRGMVCVRLPHGLISEAWTTSDRRMGLCLKVMLVVRGDGDIVLTPLRGVG